MSVYVLYYNDKLQCKVQMNRAFNCGDEFRFNGVDCMVEKTLPYETHTKVYLVDGPIAPVIKLHRPHFKKKAVNED